MYKGIVTRNAFNKIECEQSSGSLKMVIQQES